MTEAKEAGGGDGSGSQGANGRPVTSGGLGGAGLGGTGGAGGDASGLGVGGGLLNEGSITLTGRRDDLHWQPGRRRFRRQGRHRRYRNRRAGRRRR